MAKSEQTTTIEISIANRDKLYSIAEDLAKIVNKKKISLDEAFSVILKISGTGLDMALQDYILDEFKEPFGHSTQKRRKP